MADIRIRVRFSGEEAVKGLKGLEAESTRALRLVAANTKGAAMASRDHAKALELEAAASLSGAKASQFAGQTALAEVRARKAAALASLEQARTSAINERALRSETDAAKKQAQEMKRAGDARSKALVGLAGRLPASGIAHEYMGSGVLGVSGAAAVGIGAAVKAASDFEAAMVRVANNTTMTDADLKRMKETVRALGKESGASFDDLAEGFMHIMNFGFKAGEGVTVLREAMKSAVATGSSVAETADVLAKALHEFGMSAADAGKAMNVMHLAAAEGNMTLGQFDQAAGPALGVAANLGVKFTDAAAAISALTRHGYDAAEAVTQFKSVMEHAVVPTDHVHKELVALGKATGVDLVRDFSAAGLKSRGLYNIFVDLAQATRGHEEEVYKLIPAMRGGQGAMVLAGTGAKDYKDVLNDLNEAMAGRLDPTTQGYNRTLGTSENKTKRVKQEFNDLAIKVGKDLLPVLNDVAGDVSKVMDAFNKLPEGTQKGLVRLLEIATVTGLIAGNLLKVSGLMKGAGLLGGTATGAAEAGGGAAAGGGLLGFLTRGVAGGGLPGYLRSVVGGTGNWGLMGGARGTLGSPVGGNGFAGSLGGQLLGGTVLAAPALFGGYMLNKIWGQQSDQADAEMRGYGTSNLGVSQAHLSQLRRELKAHPGDPKLLRDIQRTQQFMDASLGKTGGVGAAPTSTIGEKIAHAALGKQVGLDRDAYNRSCQRLARETVSSATSAFDGIWDRSKHATAITNLRRFQKAGLAHPFKPGMALPAGSLLYSTSMGEGAGHVQVVGDGGRRYDQHGVNQFRLSNFQWYVSPPGTGGVGGKGGRKGAPAAEEPDDSKADQKRERIAKDHAEGLVEKAGASQDAAQAAYDHCKREYERTKDPHYLVLARAALVKLSAAKMRAAQATLAKAIVEAHKDGTSAEGPKAAFDRRRLEIGREAKSAGDDLTDMLQGTPAERRKRAQDAALARQRNLVGSTEAAVAVYQRLLEKGTVKAYDPLKAALGKREEREIGLARMEFRANLADSPLDKGRLTAERDARIAEARRRTAQDLTALEETHNRALAQGYELDLARLQAQRGVLEIAQQNARTDGQKIAANVALANNTEAQLRTQRQIDALSTDPNVKALAGTNYEIGLAGSQNTLDAANRDVDDAARDRRIQLLRAQSEATDDLTEKGRLLAQAHDLEAQAAQRAGSQEAILQQQMAAQRETLDLARAAAQHGADAGLAGLLLSKDPAKAGGADVLARYEGLTVSGTLEQQKQGVRQYLDVLQTLYQVHALNRKQVLADIERLTAALKATGTLDDAQIAQIVVQMKVEISRTRTQEEARAFFGELADGAGQAATNFVHNLLHPKNRKKLFQQFAQDLGNTLESAVANAVGRAVTQALTGKFEGMLFGKDGKGDPFKGLDALFKGIKGNLLEGAAAIYGAAAMLGAMGKKKQKHSIIGGVLGAVGGFFLGGPAGALKGAEYGSAIGGMFAEGGRPPLGLPSLVGERGPELFLPDAPGRILSHADTMRALTAAPPSWTGAAATQHVQNVTQHIHNPTYNSGADQDRDHERLARALDTAFVLG